MEDRVFAVHGLPRVTRTDGRQDLRLPKNEANERRREEGVSSPLVGRTRIMFRKAFWLVLMWTATSPVFADSRWHQMLSDSSAALASGDYNHALKVSSRVVDEMVDRLGPGDAETHAFAIAVAHKALSNAGLSRLDDALWYWYLAIALYPAISESDISAYGSAGDFLKANLPKALEVTCRVGDKDVTEPKLLKRVNPTFPAGAQGFGVEGVLIVEVVVDQFGRISSPHIKKPLPAPTFSYSALEAVRKWRFEPGKLHGEAVPVILSLSVNFKLR